MEYFGCCVDNPFGSVNKLNAVIDGGRKVSKKKFLENVDAIDEDFMLWGHPVIPQIKQFPHDFSFFHNQKYKTWFFTHSGIEFFFR